MATEIQQLIESLYNHKVIIIAIIIIALILTDLILVSIKSKIKIKFDTKKSTLNDLQDIEKESIQYYLSIEKIAIYRFAIYFITISIILLAFNIQAFSVFAIATGAIIVTLRDLITSFISYFYVMAQYEIGNDLRVEGILGEVVRIRPLYTGLAGKDDNGDYNGKLHLIPNFMLSQKIVERQELKTDQYRRVQLTFLFKKEEHTISYADWVKNLKDKLNELLPHRGLRQVGNYKGYAGVKYKLSYDYDDKGCVIARLSFISKPGKDITERKELIIEYLESIKTQIKA